MNAGELTKSGGATESTSTELNEFLATEVMKRQDGGDYWFGLNRVYKRDYNPAENIAQAVEALQVMLDQGYSVNIEDEWAVYLWKGRASMYRPENPVSGQTLARALCLAIKAAVEGRR